MLLSGHWSLQKSYEKRTCFHIVSGGCKRLQKSILRSRFKNEDIVRPGEALDRLQGPINRKVSDAWQILGNGARGPMRKEIENYSSFV